MSTDFPREALQEAVERRSALHTRLQQEQTQALRWFHGRAEGWPGVTVDQYGDVLLVQTFGEPLVWEQWQALNEWSAEQWGETLQPFYNHRGKTRPSEEFVWEMPKESWFQEGGLEYLFAIRKPGVDPSLFLDFRTTRQWVRENSEGCSVLNLFSYTCGIGLCAAAGGAKEVWNVDFAEFPLEVGRQNAERNGLMHDKHRFVREDYFPVIRQLAGLPMKGRSRHRRKFVRLQPRQFDRVILDPPRWARSPWGAVDLVRDYQSLFKPALLATADGGVLLAANNVASVDRDEWVDSLERCAAKAGRPLTSLELLRPDEDFPSFDNNPPLKVAICRL